jgi:molecular chaperone HtpG
VLEENQTKLADIFKKALGVTELEVKVEKLKNAETPAMITLSEDMRRMQDMMKMYGMDPNQMGGTEGQTLVLNANNTLVQYVLENPEGEHVDLVCQQIYDLALLGHCPLSADAMTKFIARSNEILKLLTK